MPSVVPSGLKSLKHVVAQRGCARYNIVAGIDGGRMPGAPPSLDGVVLPPGLKCCPCSRRILGRHVIRQQPPAALPVALDWSRTDKALERLAPKVLLVQRPAI